MWLSITAIEKMNGMKVFVKTDIGFSYCWSQCNIIIAAIVVLIVILKITGEKEVPKERDGM